MRPLFLGGEAVLILTVALMACGAATGPGDSAGRVGPGGSGSQPDGLATGSPWPGEAGGMLDASPAVVGPASYCESKFGDRVVALNGCRRYAYESFQKLEPAFRRARTDSMAMESKRLEGCVRRHDGPLGVDWILVEHCFSEDKR